MHLDLNYLSRCITTLQLALSMLQKSDPDSFEYDMYRSACVKEFEIILEQSGKLLRKVLKPYFHSSKAVDQLTFKDVFRQAVLRSIIDEPSCQRWLEYRDSRNSTAHDYGANFAEETLLVLPQFISDSGELVIALKQQNKLSDAD